MPTYVTLFRWTDQGIRNVKDVPARIKASIATIEAAGGNTLGVYVTMGDYDVVAVSEGPSDEFAAAMALTIASQGNARSTTMRAFTPGEFEDIVKKIR